MVLAVIRSSGPRNASRSSAPASRATASASARSSAVRHAATAGRCAGQSRARSSWAESEIRRASESGGPTSWTPSGKPSVVKPAGTDDGGLAGVVEGAAVGREAHHCRRACAARARPSNSRTRGGRRVNIGVSTTSACVEDAVQALGVGGGLRRGGARHPLRDRRCRSARGPSRGARAARGGRSRSPCRRRRARSARCTGCPSSAPSRIRARSRRGRARAAARRSTRPRRSCSASGLTPIGGSPVETAIRSRPGSVAAASASDGPPSLTASMNRPASATVRVSGPNTAIPWCGVDLRRGRNAPALRLEPEQRRSTRPGCGPSRRRRSRARRSRARRRPRSRSRRWTRRSCGAGPTGCA